MWPIPILIHRPLLPQCLRNATLGMEQWLHVYLFFCHITQQSGLFSAWWWVATFTFTINLFAQLCSVQKAYNIISFYQHIQVYWPSYQNEIFCQSCFQALDWSRLLQSLPTDGASNQLTNWWSFLKQWTWVVDKMQEGHLSVWPHGQVRTFGVKIIFVQVCILFVSFTTVSGGVRLP